MIKTTDTLFICKFLKKLKYDKAKNIDFKVCISIEINTIPMLMHVLNFNNFR